MRWCFIVITKCLQIIVFATQNLCITLYQFTMASNKTYQFPQGISWTVEKIFRGLSQELAILRFVCLHFILADQCREEELVQVLDKSSDFGCLTWLGRSRCKQLDKIVSHSISNNYPKTIWQKFLLVILRCDFLEVQVNVIGIFA